MKKNNLVFKNLMVCSFVLTLLSGCASDMKKKNEAKETAARYWQDKAYPGKAYDVQVIEAEKDGDQYRVHGVVDGENRDGMFDPESKTFHEKLYPLTQELRKKLTEEKEKSKYWKHQAKGHEAEIYKLKVQSQVKSKINKAKTVTDSIEQKHDDGVTIAE